MFLKSLTIASGDLIIREILFHKGLNLIVDESKSSKDIKRSGNNVGKTTILRLINFCLGGSAKSIFQDPEFKDKSNGTIKAFLQEREVLITLVIKKDLAVAGSQEFVLRRNFLPRNRKIQELNGENYSNDREFELALKRALLGFGDSKPTFNQICAKNIRDDAERLDNTVKVLGSFGKDEEYEALYFFWLGVPYPDGDKKRSLLAEKNAEETLLARLRQDSNESKIEQFLAIVQTDIDFLETRKNSFNINDNYAADLADLALVNARLNELAGAQSQLELRKELIEESRRDLEADHADARTAPIAELYAQAKLLIPNLQKTYEDAVAFHNQMLAEKVKYITQELPRLDARLSEVIYKIQEALVAERQLKERLQRAGILEDLQPIIAELNAKYEQRGKLTEQAAQMEAARRTLNRITEDLELLDQAISNLDELIQSRVKVFNAHFASISYKLYGEKFALSAPQVESQRKGTKFYKLEIDTLSGRPGTGKKKGEIAAFDIAYVKFADQLQIPCLHFILHDQMEVVDHNQMIGLRDEIVNANCQLVVPILRDKLPAELMRPEYKIISLSESDKLFRV